MLQKVLLVGKIYLFCIYFSLNNLTTIQIKSGQSHQNYEIFPRKFCGVPANLLRKKNKTYLGFEVSSRCLSFTNIQNRIHLHQLSRFSSSPCTSYTSSLLAIQFHRSSSTQFFISFEKYTPKLSSSIQVHLKLQLCALLLPTLQLSFPPNLKTQQNNVPIC